MKTNKRTTRTANTSNEFLADVELENNTPPLNKSGNHRGRKGGPLQRRGNNTPPAAPPRNLHRRNTNREPLVKVGALWLKEGKNGRFMSGVIDIDDNNSIKILVFKNEYREENRHPDYVVYEVQEPARHDVAESFRNDANDDDVPF